ncbi:hypothetical protein OAG1_08440 [Agarivorans sp. OAG1]|uniref:Uncharacterized protein n=1 Tax=Agarivorans albus MKT 106 TaxID=1331007 RepID=R9PJS1_AGAAL|nr:MULTISPECIES: hypothetical protein [Agarivorans]MPW30687.1 hypothetical protein [Agarivorans sp. B2Z047]UQN42091.1 hypothetical protein LQZ07_20325 [Agarivorans sp. B2Z047]BEU02044.1 hypothetical protein OAG1_08440 [Agarivorans sp. OAG1]GAD01634.1 hypothetical protein AALB_1714 [Agarivorans albus MKT 106]
MFSKQGSVAEIGFGIKNLSLKKTKAGGVFQLLLILLGAVVLFFNRRDSSQRVWARLPTLNDYQTRYPEKTEDANTIRCIHCDSDQTWEYGLESLMDHRRECVCLACGHRLWRKEQESLAIQ